MNTDVVEQFLRRTSLRQVEVMLAVLKHNSISRAAEELGLSIAAVSRMSKRFESNLGIRVFAGEKRRTVLLDNADQIIGLLRPLMEEIVLLRIQLQRLED